VPAPRRRAGRTDDRGSRAETPIFPERLKRRIFAGQTGQLLPYGKGQVFRQLVSRPRRGIKAKTRLHRPFRGIADFFQPVWIAVEKYSPGPGFRLPGPGVSVGGTETGVRGGKDITLWKS